MTGIFNKPVPRTIADVPVLIRKITLDHFDQAWSLVEWLDSMETVDFKRLRADLEPGAPQRQAALDLIAAYIMLPGEGAGTMGPIPASELLDMPAVSVAEAFVELLEVNADFFFRTLPKLRETRGRIQSTGSALLNSLLVPDTAETASVATPWQS